MKKKFNHEFLNIETDIDAFIHDFDRSTNSIKDARNKLKLFTLKDGLVVNIKSFKVPNLLNQVIYNFFRKSKAQRSFEYAVKLLDINIGTPNPIAYYEFKTQFLFKRSFYVSEQLDYDLTFRELTKDFNYPDHDKILRSFTRFTYRLHENNIHFLDHSPGNTLIKKSGEAYDFYLVDLNRMNFESLDFETRIKNFSRLTIHKPIVEVMSDEYSKCSGEDYNKIVDLMWRETEAFRGKFYRKKRIKKKLLFWR